MGKKLTLLIQGAGRRSLWNEKKENVNSRSVHIDAPLFGKSGESHIQGQAQIGDSCDASECTCILRNHIFLAFVSSIVYNE